MSTLYFFLMQQAMQKQLVGKLTIAIQLYNINPHLSIVYVVASLLNTIEE